MDADLVRELRQLKAEVAQLSAQMVRPLDLVAPYQGLPGVRGLWPVSSRDNAAASYDLSGQGRTLTDSGTGYGVYNNIAPYLDLGGAAYQYRASEAGLVLTASLTYAAWVYFTNSASATESIASKRQAAAQIDWHLFRQNTGTLRFGVSSGGAVFAATIDTVATVAAAGWHFVAARYSGATTTISVGLDGVWASTTSSVPAALFGGTARFVIGAIEGGTNAMTGRQTLAVLSSLYLTDQALSAVFQATRAAFLV